MLSSLLEAQPPEVETLEAWRSATELVRREARGTVDRALLGGALADRLGFAFAGGYAEALCALVPGLDDVAALCATEEGGAHPRAIRTTLRDGELTGKKKWATGASSAAVLLVVASIGEAAGKNQLRVVRVAANAPGVTMRATSAPFVPEIPHAEVDLERVRVADTDVLPGDGYVDYLKPFRTIEDVHVHAALAGYLTGVARRRGWHDAVEHWLAIAAALRGLSAYAAASTHVALAGVLAIAGREVAAIEERWAAAPDAEHARWQRDRALLQVAGAARAARRERAWLTLQR